MSSRVKREYDSDSRQLQVQSTLERHNLRTFMNEYSLTSFSTGLSQIVEQIERLTPQCSVGFRSDENKKLLLRGAVVSYDWVHNPWQSMTSNGYDFKAFVTALHESIQLW